MEIDHDGRVTLVYGGASGIGREIASTFASLGSTVVIGDIDTEGGRAAAEAIGETVEFRRTDVSSYEACTDAVEEIIADHGRLDTVVNAAAAVDSNTGKPIVEEDPAGWEPHFDVTLKGPLYGTRAALPTMIEQGHGVVLTMLSDSHQGQDPNITIYGSMKGALATFTKSVAKEVGKHGIRVNAISPGTTKVDRNAEWIEEHEEKIVESYPLGRLGRPDDHASMAAFLASDQADWVTGQTISVNGGYL